MEENTNKKSNIALNLILLVLSVAGFIFEKYVFTSGFEHEILTQYSKPIGVAAIINIVAFYFTNRNYLTTYFYSKLLYRNKDIRISLSYLFRIKLGNKYLLVRSSRIKNQFQPVGGVYKYYPEVRDLFNKLEIKDDESIQIDATSKDDLRLRIKGRHLIDFLKWYDSKRGRETSPWREFSEELIKTGILSYQTFPYIYYRFIRTKKLPFTYSKYYKCREYKMYDIFQPIFTSEQEQALADLSENENDYNAKLIWSNENCIVKLGYNHENTKLCEIGEHTEFIL